jgi:hypothetical protein
MSGWVAVALLALAAYAGVTDGSPGAAAGEPSAPAPVEVASSDRP